MLNHQTLIELKDYVLFYLENRSLKAYDSIYENNEILNETLNEIEHYIKTNSSPPFNKQLLLLIDHKGFTDTEVYKRAGLNRKHFSKIRTNPSYKIGKKTAIALALSLQLDEGETERLLRLAGFSLSESEPFDLVIRYCIEKKIYNVHDVNEALDSMNLKLLIE